MSIQYTFEGGEWTNQLDIKYKGESVEDKQVDRDTTADGTRPQRVASTAKFSLVLNVRYTRNSAHNGSIT